MSPWDNVPEGAVLVHIGMQAGLGDMSLCLVEEEATVLLDEYEFGGPPDELLSVQGIVRRDGKRTRTVIERRSIVTMLLHHRPEPVLSEEEVPEGASLQ